MTVVRRRTLGVALALAATVACGKKNGPYEPLRPIPTAVQDWSIERDGAAIRLHVPIPDTNHDSSRPPAVDRVEIYALTVAPDGTAPTAATLVVPANLIGTVQVRPPAKPTPSPKPNATSKPQTSPTPEPPADPRPAAGEVTTFIDPVVPANDASVRYYAAVAAASRRHSPVSALLQVPLSSPPAVPTDVKIDYTEQKLTMQWSAITDAHYVVSETDEAGASPRRLSEAPQEATTFEELVTFGKNRCLTVRAAFVKGPVTILGPATAPQCVNPRDRFPPAVPTGVQGFISDGGVNLVWSAVEATDLAGYLVLRGTGASGTLQPLMTTPITASSFRDTAVQAGTGYVYAVVAVDKAGNRSAESTRYSVTVRAPAPGRPIER